jgi:hypothetical protein
VSSLAYNPVVEPSSASRWLGTGLNWYEKEQYWPVELTESGPASWQHAPVGRLVPASHAVPSPGTTVSHITTTDSSIAFDVSRIGTPVVVKIPYFPNWQATGATGPYEAMPNVMVVVPTSHHVTLVYGTTKVDWIGKGASLVGLVGLGALVMRSPVDVGPDPAGPVAPAAPAEPGSSTPPLWDPLFDADLDPDLGEGDGAGDRDEAGEAGSPSAPAAGAAGIDVGPDRNGSSP